MRQIGSVKDDPLKRIQEEINEVACRERELREKMQLQQQLSIENGSTTLTTSTLKNQNIEKPSIIDEKDEASNCVVVDLNQNQINCDELHSDDSGISASSSPVNGLSTNNNLCNNNNNNNNKKKYIRSNFNAISSTPQQKLLTRAVSTPQIFTPTSRRFNLNPSQKGLMQRFIATRGKLSTAQHFGNNNNTNELVNGLDNRGSGLFSALNITPPIIERDADGRIIRRGYIPVEEKIQKELKDIKTRESELKKIRKMNAMQSQPDLLDSIENGEFELEDDAEVEHCFPPGKLRSSKSISELCDGMNIASSLSPRTTPSPTFDRKSHNNGGLRPAISLAQLCDLDPEEAPSSHELIAKWESLIQQNA